jgi:hypothetical protein
LQRDLGILSRLTGRFWRLFSDEIWPNLTGLLRFVRRREQATLVWPAPDAALGPRVAIIVHYDRRGRVRPGLLRYIAELREAGCDVIVVSNAGHLAASCFAALQACCSAVLVRRNVGYDFGAWQEAMACFGLPRPGTELLILANDSVYGPLGPLAPVLARIDIAAAPFWGLTDSWQHRYHLQSYFLAAGPAVLRSPAWPAFWRTVRPAPNKRFIIRRYEVGLTQALLREGHEVRAVWPYQTLTEMVLNDAEGRRGAPSALQRVRNRHHGNLIRAILGRRALNPTSDLWRLLLIQGFPFIKKELLRLNPGRVLDLADWRDVVAHHFPQARLAELEQDLAISVRNRAP